MNKARKQRDAQHTRMGSAWLIAGLLATLPARADSGEPQVDLQAPPPALVDKVVSSFVIDEEDPESSVPPNDEALKKPLQMGYWIMQVSDRAIAATERGDFSAALKYYKALAKAAPDRSVSYAKVCAAHQALNETDKAIESCKTALGKAGVTVRDHANYVRLVLSKQGALDASDVGDLDAVISHLEAEISAPSTKPEQGEGAWARAVEQKSARMLAQQLRCELGTRLEDERRLQTCVDALTTLAPDDPKTITFAWALALTKRDFEDGRRIVERAKKAGLPEEAILRMDARLEVELERTPVLHRAITDKRVWGAALLLALGAGAALFVTRRRTRVGVTAAS